MSNVGPTDLGSAGDDPTASAQSSILKKIGNKSEQLPAAAQGASGQKKLPAKTAQKPGTEKDPQSPIDDLGEAASNLGSNAFNEIEKAHNAIQQKFGQGDPTPKSNPVVQSLYSGMLGDPYTGYQMARWAWQGLQSWRTGSENTTNTSVRNWYESQNGFNQAILHALAFTPPVMGLAGYQQAMPDINKAIGQQTQQHGLLGVPMGVAQGAATAVGNEASMAAKNPAELYGNAAAGAVNYGTDPTSYMMGEGKAFTAANVAYGVLNATLGAPAGTTPQQMAWSIGLAVVLGGGHLPSAMKDLIKARMPDSSDLVDQLAERVSSNIEKQGQLMGGAAEQQKFWDGVLGDLGPDWQKAFGDLKPIGGGSGAAAVEAKAAPKTPYDALLEDLIKTGATKPTQTVLKRAPEGVIGEYVKDPATGEIMLKANAKREEALKKMGIESTGDLMDALEAGSLTKKQIDAMQKTWKSHGLPYDLVSTTAGERPLVNPADHLAALPAELQKQGESAMTFLRMFVDHSHRGPMGNEEVPLVSLWRSLNGFNRTTDFMHQHLIGSWARLLGDEATKTSVQQDITRAAEGDEAVYSKLTPQQKMVADSWRVAIAGLRRVSKQSGYANNFVDYWFPRLRTLSEDMKKERAKMGGGGASEVLSGERRQHRSLQATLASLQDEADPLASENKFVNLTQRYTSVFDLNKDQAKFRETLKNDILDPQKPVDKVKADAGMVKAIRSMKSSDIVKQSAAAEKLAQETLPDYETNFLAAANRALGNQLGAVHSHMAVTHLLDTELKGGERAAFDLSGLSGYQKQRLTEMGYVTPSSPWFKNVMVHPEFAKLLNRGARVAQTSKLVKGSAMGALLNVEQKAIASIMYSPMIHGMNIAGRFGAAWMMHPLGMTRYLTRGGVSDALGRLNIFHSDMYGETAEDAYNKAVAYRAGVIPPSRYSRYASEAYGAHADATGDHAIAESPGLSDASSISNASKVAGLDKVAPLGKRVQSGWDQLQNFLWKNVSDFGTMMYHVENESLKAQGMGEEAARLYAARRANSWMGHVAPEDTNPVLHDLARTAFFAPNWWRTYGELLTGVYRNAGFKWTPRRIGIIAGNEIRTALAMYGFQKMTGNTMNYALSGHTQSGNQPGNQDKIEITDPGVIMMLQKVGIGTDIDPQTGENPNTGARLTIENPMARQQYAAESAAGYESGQQGTPLISIGGQDILSGPTSQDAAWTGLRKEVASRFSPVANAVAALGNVDLYNTIASGQVTHVNQSRTDPGLDNALLALAYLTPLGYKAANAIEQAEGVYGTKSPPSVTQAIGGLKNAGLQSVLSALTGVNPATEPIPKTQGQNLSDSQYQQLSQINNQYSSQMDALQAELVSGQITPDQWRQQYELLSSQHAVTTQAFYKNAPEYTQGTQGLVAQYEDLYSDPRVTNADGTVNYEALATLQQQFRSDHTMAQMNSVDSELAKTEQKYPAVKMYKDAVSSYQNFQDQWAQQNGVNTYQLQNESSQYGQLYGTPEANVYLGEHPDLVAWEAAKRQWLRTPDGYSYGLFEGSSTTIKEADSQAGTTSALDQAAAGRQSGNLNVLAQSQLDKELLTQMQAAGLTDAQIQAAMGAPA